MHLSPKRNPRRATRNNFMVVSLPPVWALLNGIILYGRKNVEP